MKPADIHTDPFFKAFQDAANEFQPDFSVDEVQADWSSVKSGISAPQSPQLGKPDVSGGLKSLLNLKNIVISSVAGIAIIATTVVLLNRPDPSNQSATASTENNNQNTIPAQSLQSDSATVINNVSSTVENDRTTQQQNVLSPNQQTQNDHSNTAASGYGSTLNQTNQNSPVPTNDKTVQSNNQSVEERNTTNFPSIYVRDKGWPKSNEIFVSDTQFCQNQKLTVISNLADPSNQKIYVSVQGKALYASNEAFSYQFPKPGWYNLAIIVNSNNSYQTKNYRLLVVSSPVASFAHTLGENYSVKFENKSKYADKFSWNFGDNSKAGAENPSHRYFDTGIYKVTLIAASDGLCADTVIKWVKIDGITEIDIPNTFSPNNDGVNDLFFIRIQNEVLYELTIFDRNANLVYISKDKNEKWNGIHKDTGKECAPGTYFYFLNYQLRGQQQPSVKSGTISLFR